MELTGIVNLRSDERHVVVLPKRLIRADIIGSVAKFYCNSSKNYEVTFELDHGNRHLTLIIDFFLFDPKPEYQIAKLVYSHNITGIITTNLKEAEQISTVIEKAYAWALLK